MGRDLGAVRLLRNAEAAAATAAAAADALAVGDRVLLSPGQDLASPRGLGLLAHELTHVLRGRDSDFLPLVARAQPQSRATGPSAPGGAAQAGPRPVAARSGGMRLGSTRPGDFPPSGSEQPPALQNRAALPGRAAPGRAAFSPGAARRSLDEEGLAEYVEAQVRQQVQTDLAGPGRSGAGPLAGVTAPPGLPSPALTASEAAPWGALPAPWEPMPFWDAPASGGPSGTPEVGAGGRSAPGAGSGAVSGTQASPVAQAASSTRSVDSSPPPAAPPALGEAVGSDRFKSGRPAPDLDRLAQQVYGLIKRRLATETRRNR